MDMNYTKSKIDQLLWYLYFMQLHNCGHTSVGSANIRCTWLMCLLLLSTKKTPYHTKIPLPFKEYDHIWFPCSKRPDEKILLNESFFTFWDFRGDETAPNLSNIVSPGNWNSNWLGFFLIHFHFRTMNNAWKGICICFKAIFSLLSWKESKKAFKMVTK